MKRKQRGFTLVEVLIVVIIIAILAALILPRMTAQTGRAEIAEAQQMLGVLRRAMATYIDTTGDTALGVNSVGAVVADWGKLGMAVPNSAKYSYECSSGTAGVCKATTLVDSAVGVGSTIEVGVSGGNFTCGGTNYTYAVDSDHSKGCTKK